MKNWQSEVSPKEKIKFGERAVKGKSRYVNENWRTSRQRQVQTKIKKNLFNWPFGFVRPIK